MPQPLSEIVTLTETGADTGVFEGSIELGSNAASQPGVLETLIDYGPPFQRDAIDASYQGGAASASAAICPSLRGE